MKKEKKYIEVYQKTIDALPMGILYVDKDLKIRIINNCYATQLGGDVDKLLGKYLPDFIPGTFANRVMERNQAELGDICTLPLSGDKLRFIVNRIPITNQSKEVVGMVSNIMFTDPTQLKSLSNKVDELLKQVAFYRKNMTSLLRSQYNIDCIIGNSPQISSVKDDILRYAATNFPVLVQGPTGTGKELVANAIHAESRRKSGPFISINCAAIPKDLIEAELFGYEAGAFSGAHRNGKPGLIEMADKGTLFLDEIGDMPLSAQVKLLRVLEQKSVSRVGSVSNIPVDFRLVSATNRDIFSMIEQGTFREDLYYRLCALTISLPSLANRPEDIIPISKHLLSQMGYGHLGFSPQAVIKMQEYAWPGNVRQLFNALAHASLHCHSNIIDVNDLPYEILESFIPAISNDCTLSLAEHLDQYEKSLLQHYWEFYKGNVTAMAKVLKTSRVTLYNKFKKHNLLFE